MKGIRIDFYSFRFAVLLLFVGMQIFLIFVKKHDALDLDIGPNTHPSRNIFMNERLDQTFIAKKDGLARIDVMLGTHARENDKDVIFELAELLTTENKSHRNILTQIVFNASTVKNNLYHSFKFSPIKNSQDKKYSFSFYSPESTYENSIAVWTNIQNIYKPGDYFFNGEFLSKEAVFRVYSQRPIFTELGRIVRNYEGIFGSKLFLILTIIFFEIIQIVFLWSLLGFIRKNWKSA
jgi:hypothetical protein